MKFSGNNNPGNITTRQIQKYDKDRSEKLSSAQTQGDPEIGNNLENQSQIINSTWELLLFGFYQPPMSIYNMTIHSRICQLIRSIWIRCRLEIWQERINRVLFTVIGYN